MERLDSVSCYFSWSDFCWAKMGSIGKDMETAGNYSLLLCEIVLVNTSSKANQNLPKLGSFIF